MPPAILDYKCLAQVFFECLWMFVGRTHVLVVWLESIWLSNMARPPRKAHGQGRLSLQRLRRRKLSSEVAARLMEVLDLESVENTGNMIPRRLDLRRKTNRKFVFLREYDGRTFTTRLCQSVIRQLLALLPFKLIHDPRSDIEEVIKAQSARLKALAKRSKRIRAKRKMDDLDTQPYEPWIQGNLSTCSWF